MQKHCKTVMFFVSSDWTKNVIYNDYESGIANMQKWTTKSATIRDHLLLYLQKFSLTGTISFGKFCCRTTKYLSLRHLLLAK